MLPRSRREKLIILQPCSRLPDVQVPVGTDHLPSFFMMFLQKAKMLLLNIFFLFSSEQVCFCFQVKKISNINVDLTEEFGVLQNLKLLCINNPPFSQSVIMFLVSSKNHQSTWSMFNNKIWFSKNNLLNYIVLLHLTDFGFNLRWLTLLEGPTPH